MNLQALKEELKQYYWNEINDQSEEFRKEMYDLLDEQCTPDMNGYQRKALQYKVITEHCQPMLFPHSPFYHELGTISAHCDGAGSFHGHVHAGNWNYERSEHLFVDQDPELYKVRSNQGDNQLYLICGPYCDTRQHFIFNCKPLFRGGLKKLYDEAREQLAKAQTQNERDFLAAAIEGLLCLKIISEKFSKAAGERLKTASDPQEIANYQRIQDAAAYSPWNAPRTFYEALNLLAFCRTACGALEGIGYNTFGRPDVELLPFYERDLAAGFYPSQNVYLCNCRQS